MAQASNVTVVAAQTSGLSRPPDQSLVDAGHPARRCAAAVARGAGRAEDGGVLGLRQCYRRQRRML